MGKIILVFAAVKPGVPRWSKPNAGLPRTSEDGQAIDDVAPQEMGASALRNIANGARIAGGCCRSSPAHVAGIVQAVRSVKA